MTTRKLYLELENCIGCRACVAACTQCGGHEEKNRNFVYDVDPFVSTETMPLMCLHCVDPACARSCPAQAIQIHETGAVLSALVIYVSVVKIVPLPVHMGFQKWMNK